MGIHRTPLNRRSVTLAAGMLTAGTLLLAGPAATAFAAPSEGVTTPAKPDYTIGGFLSNAGQFAGTLGTNTNQFLGTLGTNGEQFGGTLGTNALIFAGTLGNNLVGNPPGTGSKTPTSNISAQCNSTGAGSCAVT